MNRQLIEHLFRHKFHLEDRVQKLKEVKDFDSEHASELHKLELFSAKGRLSFVNETLDIVLPDNQPATTDQMV